ncbi:uncharacterized protein F5891DRAFT_1281362 [Suillus fuscotomentosus]|uniref:NACHT domain-containing protein n=1 Tax=Suillus fuscotomentosus TaxID=1912939 RepID=A0AAD4HFU1_9AGAM|nr:uncharacterized protein F5891DRAFT_1281362 [Suillus fuscotomentosus]KAG1894942.1 hypothetical protein F5891DRAFT_1281362 [Suillus fuscotomentosus]
MSEDHRPDIDPPPGVSRSSQANVVESSNQSRGGLCQSLRKLKNGLTKKLPKRSTRTRNRTTAVQNVESEGASSSQKVEDTLHLHTSNDNKHPTTSEILSDSVNQGLSGEPASQAAPSDKDKGPDPQLVDAELQGAYDGTQNMKLLGKHAISMASAADNAPAGLAAADNFEMRYLQPLMIIDGVLEKIADIHPYAKMVLGVLSAASKIIVAQAERDKCIYSLLKKLAEVYRFMTQDDSLSKIESMRGIVGKIVQQTLECARFIRDYSETKNFWKRLGKNVLSETDDVVKRYSDTLDDLVQQFRDQVDRDVAVFVQRTGDTLDLGDIAYAKGAGLNTMKQCLPGTRKEMLSQITDWINGSGDAAQRVLWLSGPAGTGKSAIAQTIAKGFNDMGVLGSCFCFDKAEKRHEKVFSTIARDLADRDPEMRRALADAVKNSTSLKNPKDIFQQWEKLLMNPLKKFPTSSVGPVLIVIEALDESGGVETRRDLLRILAGKLQNKDLPQITELPFNFRILVTSRPLHDIEDAFHGAQHILPLSMDQIPATVAERDIRTFVSEELKGLSDFHDKEFASLAAKADGLFEWARLACEYIKDTPPGVRQMPRFNAYANRSAGKQKNLLYDMYLVILKDIMKRDQHDDDEYEEALAGFRSVMGQILGTAEPLPFNSLNIMRNYFPDRSKDVIMDIIKRMGSLLSGTTNLCTPIRPLHASFHDFLTDKSSSGDFFVQVSNVQRDLAFASLRVMEDGLCFNICDLKSSYLPNSQDTGLPQRVKTCIPLHLSYSCRYWTTHVQTTDFDDERLLFWIEALGLLNAIRGAIIVLPLVAKWLKGHSGYEDLQSTTMDVQRFIQVFGGMILHSTPHLYLSALPFSPVNSTMATKFTTRFLNNLRLASGRDLNWTVVQTIINGHTGAVSSLSFSPDGTRIASGSWDRTVRLWDAATGQPLSEPLLGHTGAVESVSFSPDGTRIASGSLDSTVRLWDAATGQPLGEPLKGHTGEVRSVSFSPDGTRIVSGSLDRTVRLWDAATGQPLSEPLQGHTAGVTSVSFSPNGTRIVSGSWDSTMRLWDAATGQPLGDPLQGHTGEVWSVSFSLDGTRIVSGSDDHTVRLWDAATGQPLGGPLEGHTEDV